MTGETNLATLLKTAKPVHNVGDYVFCQVADAGRFVDTRDLARAMDLLHGLAA